VEIFPGNVSGNISKEINNRFPGNISVEIFGNFLKISMKFLKIALVH